MENKTILTQMIRIFQTYSEDWMGYAITRKKRVFAYLIKNKAQGGKEEAQNYALLTKDALYNLNKIKKLNPALYSEYHYWFRVINDCRGPIPDEIKAIMYNMKQRCQTSLSSNKKKHHDTYTKRIAKMSYQCAKRY